MDGIMEREEGAAGTEVVVSGFASYRQYKQEMDRELTQAAESFVRIGYLLRVAEDTDILRESGYRGVAEFAAAEYSLDKTQVSRFININIQFSEGGYSDHLKERYKKFGYAKLAVMLSLPEEVREELPDSLSKADIQDVAEEIKAEAAISDIEAAIERAEAAPVQPEGQETSLLYQAAAQLCREQQDLFRRLWMEQASLEDMQAVLAPLGEAVFMVRVLGTGRLMVTVRDQETSITAVRTGDKERCSTEEFAARIWGICIKGMTPEDAFRVEFGEEMEKGKGIPPAQDPLSAAGGEKRKPKQRRVSRVTKARPKPGPEAAVEGTPAAGEEEQLPGQMEVYDYPEIIPGGTEEGNHGTEGKGAAGGEDPEDTGEDPGAGADGGRHEDIPEHHEVHGAAEDDGCAEDLECVGGQGGEKIWQDVLYELEAVKRGVVLCDNDHPDMDAGQLRELYQAAIRLAAAVEEILIRSEKNE